MLLENELATHIVVHDHYHHHVGVNMKPVPGGGSASPAATKTNILIGVGLTRSWHTQWGQLFYEIEFVS